MLIAELTSGEPKVKRNIPAKTYNFTSKGTGVVSIYGSKGIPIID